MEVVKKEIEVGKESAEVIEAIAALISDIKAKKPAVEIALGNLQKLSLALEGVEKLDDEQKTHLASNLAFLGIKVGEVLLKKNA